MTSQHLANRCRQIAAPHALYVRCFLLLKGLLTFQTADMPSFQLQLHFSHVHRETR